MTEDIAAPGEMVVRCDCGFEMRGADADLIPAAQTHGQETHIMDVTREQALEMARLV